MEKFEKRIPYGRQTISEEDIENVSDVLRSKFLTQGPAVLRFEESIASYCGSKSAVSANSATSALHLACLALGLGPGDILWTSPITFVASSNVALLCGAKIDFVDIDPKSYNISIDLLEKKLKKAEKIGQLPKIIMPVHLCGQSCEMERIYTLSKKYGFRIIEDASHAIGARYKDDPVGNCRYSDICVFSFHPVKIITSGEGGMATTNSSDLARIMRELRSHGITRENEAMRSRPKDEIWNYQQTDLGYNYRMTDIQAALGLSQLSSLDDFVKSRHNIVELYNDKLKSLPIILPWQHPDSWSSFHLYPIRVREIDAGISQKNLYKIFHESQIEVNLHYIPVYLQPYYKEIGFERGYCPESENYFREAISLPIFSSMSKEDLERIVTLLMESLA